MPEKTNSEIENEVKFLIQDIGGLEEAVEGNYSLAECEFNSSKLLELIGCLNELIDEKTFGNSSCKDLEEEPLFSLDFHQITVEEIIELVQSYIKIG